MASNSVKFTSINNILTQTLSPQNKQYRKERNYRQKDIDTMKTSAKTPLRKNSSIGSSLPKPTTKPTPNKPLFSFEFPTSPQSNVPPELLNITTHPNHPLARVSAIETFLCSGCKENGAGKRVCCQKCDFQLHEFCAKSPLHSALNHHPLHPQHQLQFHTKPKSGKGGIVRPKCDMCGKATKGFTFRCHACSFQIHPCCAMLSTEMKFTIHPHPLKLIPTISTSSDPYVFSCLCKSKQTGSRMYVCTVCSNYYLHALCAKNLINGLGVTGTKPGPVEKPNKLGNVAHAASVVVMEFVGGLIEGIGEGVGEAIFQNIGRGRDINSNGGSSSHTKTKREKAKK